MLTSSELRHDFVRKAFGVADGIDVVQSFREGLSGTTLDRARAEGLEVKLNHLRARARSEEDFFGPFVSLVEDRSNPVDVPRGDVDDRQHYEEITDLAPDLLVAYGCSILRGPLLTEFRGRFLNVHLGLSPYYRGTGTNFWPLVNGEPEYVGATFMYIDEGVDTGEIVHQIRARVYPDDSPHQVGNRLIADMTRTYIEIVRRFAALEPVDKPSEPKDSNYHRRDDYTMEATRRLYKNFESGLVERYLEEREERVRAVPIVSNPALDDFDVAADSPVEP
jgi:folate-dependent phosphoribosylglycinamide formyltransferase PurN